MFEQPPDNLPVQDIFEKIEPTPVAGPGSGPPTVLSRPKPSALRPVGSPSAAMLESPGSGAKRIFLFIGISVAVVAVLGGGGYFLLRLAQDKAAGGAPIANVPSATAPTAVNANVPTTNVPTEVAATGTEPVTAAPTNVPLPQPVVAPSQRDTDTDGLTDAQEIAIGTDPNKADTDGDGLTDFDEVRTWQSDPLNADSDGDGYTDGAEVKNGYSPTGPGRIIVNQ